MGYYNSGDKKVAKYESGKKPFFKNMRRRVNSYIDEAKEADPTITLSKKEKAKLDEENAKYPYKDILENPSAEPLDDIATIIRQQLASYSPVQFPREMIGAAGAGIAGSTGAHMIGLLGQDTKEYPFVPNPTDVAAAFQKVPTDVSNNLMDNFYLRQQRSLTQDLQNSGASAYDVGNILAKPMADASQGRSQAALENLYRNTDMDRNRAIYNIQVAEGVNNARSQEKVNQNMLTAGIAQKTGESLGQFGNLTNTGMERQMQMEALNNAKMASLMNTLFTVNYLKKLK
jgi:hypothetical protein